ncbi:MAG: DUF3791 domain-containing protein [Proteobacteria bacterium]|nr:DUF3791 domain-containing protein [Pseudomonadota bacterium]
MTKETEFFIYLLERYADYKSRTAPEVLKEWDELKLTDLIYDLYEIYHAERLQNAFDDIDLLIQERLAAPCGNAEECQDV